MVRGAAAPAVARVRAAAVLGGVVTLYAVAFSLRAPAIGYGAHEQLLLAPCPMPIVLGIPCPTCGMTTAVVHFAHGRLLASFHVQPAGFTLAVALLCVAGLAVEAVITGRPRTINWYRVSPVRFAITAGGVLLAGWAYKLVVMRLAG